MRTTTDTHWRDDKPSILQYVEPLVRVLPSIGQFKTKQRKEKERRELERAQAYAKYWKAINPRSGKPVKSVEESKSTERVLEERAALDRRRVEREVGDILLRLEELKDSNHQLKDANKCLFSRISHLKGQISQYRRKGRDLEHSLPQKPYRPPHVDAKGSGWKSKLMLQLESQMAPAKASSQRQSESGAPAVNNEFDRVNLRAKVQEELEIRSSLREQRQRLIDDTNGLKTRSDSLAHIISEKRSQIDLARRRKQSLLCRGGGSEAIGDTDDGIAVYCQVYEELETLRRRLIDMDGPQSFQSAQSPPPIDGTASLSSLQARLEKKQEKLRQLQSAIETVQDEEYAQDAEKLSALSRECQKLKLISCLLRVNTIANSVESELHLGEVQSDFAPTSRRPSALSVDVLSPSDSEDSLSAQDPLPQSPIALPDGTDEQDDPGAVSDFPDAKTASEPAPASSASHVDRDASALSSFLASEEEVSDEDAEWAASATSPHSHSSSI